MLAVQLGLIFRTGTYVDAVGGEQPIIDFSKLFLVPAAIALGAAVLLFVFFHPPARKEVEMKDMPAAH